MIDLVPLLSTILPIVALTLVIFVFAINLISSFRRRFPVKVNCWFCNAWTYIHYDNKDSFDCPQCLQYNGFTKDGGYNKIIPEQHDELPNSKTQVIKQQTTPVNGLCLLCNNNQQLKVFQLANFVPLNEENYDLEIEHFEEQLEKAYKLCKKCDRVLKKTLEKQNSWLFGKRLRSCWVNTGVHKITNNRPSIIPPIINFISLILVLILIMIILFGVKYFTTSVPKFVPESWLPLFKAIILFANTQKLVISESILPKPIKIDAFFITSLIGCSLQILGIVFFKSTTFKVNRLLCWIILLLTSWLRFSKNYTTSILCVEAMSCTYLLLTAFYKDERVKESAHQNSGKKMRKLVKNLENTCTDFSELSDFENVSSSSSKLTGDSNDTATNNTLNKTKSHDLNLSLHNLSLGRPVSSLQNLSLRRPKRVLSPPKFQPINSWEAAGFWKEGPISHPSRSSSESSGFGSQCNEIDRFSEMRTSPSPSYLFAPITRPPSHNFWTNRSPKVTYQPPRTGIENWSDKINLQTLQSFSDLSLNTNECYY